MPGAFHPVICEYLTPTGTGRPGRDNWGMTGSGETAAMRQDRASGHRASPLDYDAEVQRHDDVLRRAWGVKPHDHVVDIGCGLGQTTCAVARMAYAGSALGVDISASAVERAREIAQAQGIDNAAFECADAQVHLFPQERFDLAISRFGSMFFADPVAAFSNVGQALRPAGRLVMMVWQARDRNEWDVAIRQALAEPGGSAVTVSAGSEAFSHWSGPAASPAPAKHSTGWITPTRQARCDGCRRCSPRTWARTVSGSAPARGSSPPTAAQTGHHA
jgi:SAM-dependent methyltransferase